MTKNESTRVGFLLPLGYWVGGRNYLKNLFAAIRMLPGNPIVPVIFTGKRQGNNTEDFPGVEVIRTSMLDRRSPTAILRKGILKASGHDILLQKSLQKHGVSVLSHCIHPVYLGMRQRIKIIGWIADFQHVHLPELFTLEDRNHRDLEFKQICAQSDKIILSSACAYEDLRAFAPEHIDTAELLRFVASPTPLQGAASLPELQRLYTFTGPYFLLPNQFWAHKNHRVVISALQRLKSNREPLLVLAAGSPTDYRNSSFFSDLMKYALECDVLDCFRVLGQIPFDHLFGLMQHATAFINPSRFEGWSTSVEEAKSLGKQIVLSDIPVHREQAPPGGFFFPAEDPDALAKAMKAAHDRYDGVRDSALRTAAAAHFPTRQREFGETYLRIVEDTLGRKANEL